MKTTVRNQKIPRPLSEGEETLAIHLRSEGISFQREQVVNPDKKYRWDFILGTCLSIPRYVIDIQGGTHTQGRHTRAQGYADDCIKANLAVRDGYLPLHFTTDQVKSGHAIDFIKDLLLSNTDPDT